MSSPPVDPPGLTAQPMPHVALNPLDLALYAADEARRQLGSAGADIHLYLECTGRIDVAGLRRALAALHRAYPVTAARLEVSRATGRPRWRLPIEAAAGTQVGAVEERTVDANGAFDAAERLLSTRVDWRAAAPAGGAMGPLRFYVLHGPVDDTVIMRWPHFLMDARGGATLLEQLAALYESGVVASDVRSAGDEHRRDFGQLALARGVWAELRAVLDARRAGGPVRDVSGSAPDVAGSARDAASAARGADSSARGAVSAARDAAGSAPPREAGAAARGLPRPRDVVRLCRPADLRHGGSLRLAVRRLDSSEAAALRDAALRTCGFGRVADFVRAAGLCAAHETLGSRSAAAGWYSTLHLVDNRRRRDPGPVCHNVFSTLPVYVPCELAGDRAATADLIRDQTAAALASGLMQARLAGLQLLARVPTRLLVQRMRGALRRSSARMPLGWGRAPSLPLGFMGPLARPTPRFCGAPLRNLLGVRLPSPAAGFGITVNLAQQRANLALVYDETALAPADAEALLERYAARLTN